MVTDLLLAAGAGRGWAAEGAGAGLAPARSTSLLGRRVCGRVVVVPRRARPTHARRLVPAPGGRGRRRGLGRGDGRHAARRPRSHWRSATPRRPVSTWSTCPTSRRRGPPGARRGDARRPRPGDVRRAARPPGPARRATTGRPLIADRCAVTRGARATSPRTTSTRSSAATSRAERRRPPRDRPTSDQRSVVRSLDAHGPCVHSAADVAARLGATGYLADEGLATVLFLALTMQRPLLLEGEPGTGKTALAEALAQSARPAADPAAVLRGHRRHPGALRLGLPAPDPAPARARGRRLGRPRTSRRPRRACTTSGSCSPDRCCARCSRARPCCWSTRSTAPTTSSRRSCSRCSSTCQVTIPELGTVQRRDRRRSWCSPPTAPASCTTRSSGAASTTGSTTPGLDREVAIVRSRAPEVADAAGRQVVGSCSSCAIARPAQAARRGRDARLGAGAARPRHHASSTWRRAARDPGRGA